MFDTRAVERDFGRAAKEYETQAHLQRQVRRYCIELAQQCWESGAQVLDLGSGTDTLHKDSLSLGIDWQIVDLDLALGMCREARKQHAMVVSADAKALPFADDSFNGIFSSLMLQWVDTPLAVLREIQRVLKPGGHCVLSTFTEGTLSELRAAFAAVDNTPHVSEFFPAPALVTSAVHAGFAAPHVEEATITEHYPDAKTLMHSLKAVGATNKQQARRKGLMTPDQLQRLEEAYARKADGQGLPATWKVLYLVLQKR